MSVPEDWRFYFVRNETPDETVIIPNYTLRVITALHKTAEMVGVDTAQDGWLEATVQAVSDLCAKVKESCK